NLLVFSEAEPTGAPFIRGRWASTARWVGLAEFIDANRLYSSRPDLGYLKPLLRADALRRAGLRYDESLRIGEDYDFLARAMARGLRFRFEPAALYRYRKHAGSTSHRSRVGDFTALIAAHDRFKAMAAALQSDIAGALRRRRRSLETLLAYDQVITDLKAGYLAAAAARAVRRPSVWPLLG